MMQKEFLILIVVYFKAFADSEHFKDYQPRCHLQTISCPCERRHGEQLNVTTRKCIGNQLNVCNRKAVITKCRTAYLSHKRQRRDTGSQTLICHNGTIKPADSSPSIKTSPEVTINGVARDAKTDDYVKFRCTVVSNLAANVTWLFNGSPLGEQMIHRHSYSNCKMVLYIKRVTTKDTGNYTCVVQNEIGRAMASSYLTVTRKQNGPFITDMGLDGKTGSNTAVVGSFLNLTCKNQDVQVINFFEKDGIRLYEEDQSHYEMYFISNKEQNAKVSKLEIKNVTFEDTGNYTCVAWLKGFTKRKTFYLRIVNASQSCRPGYYCPPGSQQPLKCPAGTYQPSMGALSKSDCRPCPWGSYQPLVGGNFSKKPDHLISPAVNVMDCPPGYRSTGGPSSEKEKQSSTSGRIATVEIIGIVFGILGAVVITLFVTICIARKWPWLSLYKTRKTTSNQHDLESLHSEMIVAHSELNGLCGDTNNVQHLQVFKRPPEKDYDAKYDVFICYSSKDLSWVKELLAELEKRGFVCCIDFKDFTVGATIVDNITQAIYYSRKTVAVLTPDFVESEWCSHELQKALTRIRSHQVVPIVYKNCDIPFLLRDRTYLDWENCHVKPYFWEQLEKALKLPNDVEIPLGEPIEANPADQLLS